MFGISLGLTLAIELPIAYSMGIRSGRGILIVLLTNVLTNPAAVYAAFLLKRHFPAAGRFTVELPIEAAVFTAEWLIYRSFRETDDEFKKPFLLSLVCNAVSYGIGILIQL